MILNEDDILGCTGWCNYQSDFPCLDCDPALWLSIAGKACFELEKDEEAKEKDAKKKNDFSNSVRRKILKRDKYRCVLCGQGPPDVSVEVDHVIPKSRGGKGIEKNGRTLCFRCNRGKHTKLDHE